MEKAYRLYKDGEVTCESLAEVKAVVKEASQMDLKYSDGSARYGYTLVFNNCYIVKQF